MPIRFPRIRRYLAMNQGTYNRLTCEHGLSQDRVEWMSNFVDQSFRAVATPAVPGSTLPRPQRLLQASIAAINGPERSRSS